MRFLHFSDIHIPPRFRDVPIKDWFSKRLIGAMNIAFLRGRRFPGVRRKVEQLASFVRIERVDMALNTGDLTLFGTERELIEARQWMQPFAELPQGLVVVPGNHDRYARDTVRKERFMRPFGELLVSDLAGCAVDGPWPLVRLPSPHVAVVALDTAVAHWKPWHAWGELSQAQIESLAKVLDHPQVQDRFIFVLFHHAPLGANGRPDGENHGMKNADQLLETCSGIRRGAILCGHIHRCYRLQPAGLEAALFNAGSATMLGVEGGWVFDVDDGQATATRVRYRRNRYVLDERQRHEC